MNAGVCLSLAEALQNREDREKLASPDYVAYSDLEAERRQKDELVGKILAHYQARGQDPPIGLPASDVETLRKHLAHVKREAAAKGSTARPPQIAL